MVKECLPDILKKDMNIVFCGMAPGKLSCDMGHYYAKASNKFWNVLYKNNFVKSLIKPSRDSVIKDSNYQLLIRAGIGLTDLVKDDCGMDKKIKPKSEDNRLEKLILEYKPKFFVFNGKKPAKSYFGKNRIKYGDQHEITINSKIGNTRIFVLPSTSGANIGWKKYKHDAEWKKFRELVKL
jgi:TDG/mug DNA glycosylase family protein